jgi:hypothetical protein
MWELDPPPCEVYGCRKTALPLCTPNVTGIRCLDCASTHRICDRHINSLLNLGFAFKFVKNYLFEVVCPNEALIGHAVSQ